MREKITLACSTREEWGEVADFAKQIIGCEATPLSDKIAYVRNVLMNAAQKLPGLITDYFRSSQLWELTYLASDERR